MAKKKDDLVVKANALVEASYRMNLAEQRIILLAITQERKNRLDKQPDGLITVTAADYAEVFLVAKNTAFEEIKEAIVTLWGREVTVYADPTGKMLEEPLTIKWLITKAPYAADGTIRFEFHPRLKPYLAILEKNFARHTLEKIAGMTSLHAIRLYELCVDWGQNFRHRQKEVSLSWLKQVFGLEKEYKELYDLKKRVLDVAIKQINEHSDLTCFYTQRKTGRTVTHLIFEFEQKKPKERPKTKTPTKSAPKSPRIAPPAPAAPQARKTVDPTPEDIAKRNREGVEAWKRILEENKRREEKTPEPETISTVDTTTEETARQKQIGEEHLKHILEELKKSGRPRRSKTTEPETVSPEIMEQVRREVQEKEKAAQDRLNRNRK